MEKDLIRDLWSYFTLRAYWWSSGDLTNAFLWSSGDLINAFLWSSGDLTKFKEHVVPTPVMPRSGRSEPTPSQNAVALVAYPLVMQKQTHDVLYHLWRIFFQNKCN